MPKTTITYRVFIASPGDVQEERAIIKSVADELNTLNSVKNIKLEVIGWETSTYPAFGDDAQDVINTQIDDDYDIFIGVFWSRFGTKTKRDKSGTKEEFERAYKRYLEDSDSINILFYFKNAPIPPLDLDVDQIKDIQEFYTDIKSRGALISTFTQGTEFEKVLRFHLSKLLNKITNDVKDELKIKPKENPIIQLESTNDDSDDELGYWEYMDRAIAGINEITPTLTKITKQTIDLGARLKKRTNSLDVLKNKPKDLIDREARKVTDASAKDLDIFTKNVTPLVPILSDLFNNSMNFFNKAILIHKKYLSEDGLLSNLTSLKGLRTALFDGYEGSISMKDSIKSFPPLTSKLLKSRNQTVKILIDLTDEFLSYINIIDNIIKIIES